jgi:hypothetical protein
VQLVPTAGSRGKRAAAGLVMSMSWVVVSKSNDKTVYKMFKYQSGLTLVKSFTTSGDLLWA